MLRDVPAAEDLATPQGKIILKAFVTMEAAQVPFWFPPGVPQDRVTAVREAFKKVWDVSELRERAKKVGVVLDPKSGEVVAKLVEDVLNTPPELLAQLRKILVKN
jgi:tripartite-type tricarboxylate transporter receptor subunit TctC